MNTSGEVKIISKTRIGRGTLVVKVIVPKIIVTELLTTKLRIGYVNCRVRQAVDIKRCFQYQVFGHTKKDCKGPVLRDNC